jgi:transcriptional regulator with XRE-family HTH domain
MLTKGPRNNLQGKLVKELTEQLVLERKGLGLSIDQLSEKSGYAVDHLKKMECGQRNPSFNSLAIWANTLGYELVVDLQLVKK